MGRMSPAAALVLFVLAAVLAGLGYGRVFRRPRGAVGRGRPGGAATRQTNTLRSARRRLVRLTALVAAGAAVLTAAVAGLLAVSARGSGSTSSTARGGPPGESFGEEDGGFGNQGLQPPAAPPTGGFGGGGFRSGGS
jgi:hypothetical protein